MIKLLEQSEKLEGELGMAKKCTTKKPLHGNRRSHACNATKHAQKPNLQKVTVNGKTVRMSTREMRSAKKDVNVSE